MDVSKVIHEVVLGIHQNELNKQKVASRLVELKGKPLPKGNKELHEERLSYSIKPANLNCKIAGVDSGFVDKNIAGLDVVLVRACGIVFSYSNDVVKDADYWPSLYHFPIPHATNGALERDESNCSRSLLRLREELKAAKAVIENHNPDYCFIDGSIIPQYVDKPRKDSRIESLYERTLIDFQDLYAVAEANSCTLVGCVEDSRGSRLRTILQEQVLTNANPIRPERLDDMRDASLLDYFLDVGERSFTFSYSKNTAEHPILMDYAKEWGGSIYAFYLKPCLYDRPLRVECIHKGPKLTEFVNSLAGVVYTLSSKHREYAYPSVLIEADLRARLKHEEINIVFNKIMDKLGKNIKIKLRRDNRPF